MNKLLLISLLAFCFMAGFSSVNAHIYHQKIGAAMLISNGGFGTNVTPAVFYGARLNLAEPSSDMSLSLNVEPGGFFEGVISSRGGSAGAFVLDIPAYLCLNLGGYATYDSDNYFGGYFGLGYEYSTFASTFGGSGSGSGPIATGGIRLLIADNPYELGFTYMLGLGDSPNQIGIRAAFLIGDY
ncbi:MAG: hypothetical protein AB8F95_15930 [Bacteroidia bacterium]